MTLSPAVIRAAVASGVTVHQLAAIILADLGADGSDAVCAPNVTFDVTVAPEGDIAPIEPSKPNLPAEPGRPMERLVAIARKQIALVPNLSGATRRVAGAILDHYNRDSGRCDPSIGGLAAKLSLCTRTVIRSVNQLHKIGLIEKVRHGGYGHRNAYRPVWRTIAGSLEQWDNRMRDRDAPPMEAMSPLPARRQKSHLQGDVSVTQTNIRNPDRKSGGSGTSVRAPRPDPRQPQFKLPINGGRPYAQEAEQAVRTRLSQDAHSHLRQLGKQHHAEGTLRLISIDWEPAIRAELGRKGSGLQILLAAVAGADPPIRQAG